MIQKMLALYPHIPEEYYLAYDNEYGLETMPKKDLKVIFLDFEREEDAYHLAGSEMIDYDSHRNLSDYFYRKASANSVSPFPSFYISEEGFQMKVGGEGEEEFFYDSDSKSFRKLIRILNNNSELNPELQGLHEFASQNFELIIEELKPYIDGKKKTPFLMSIRIDGLSIGRSSLYESIRQSAIEEFYADFYTYDKVITEGLNMVCSMCRQIQEKVWGYVSVYNFYASKTEHAPIPGLKKELAYKNYPVCPSCARKLKRLRPVVDQFFRFKFCGFDYLLVPEQLYDVGNGELIKLIIEIMVSQYDSAPDAVLNLQGRIGEFSFSEKRKKLIDSYSKEVFDYLAQTNNFASYTMLFFQESNAEFKILLTIEDVFPSQFQSIFDAKEKAETHSIFKSLPGGGKNEDYDLEFRFDIIKEFFPIKSKTEGDFSKAFLEVARSIFMQRQIDLSFLFQRIMSVIQRRFANDMNYNLLARKAFLMLKFLNYLGLIAIQKDTNKEVEMIDKYAEFFTEHQDYFDSSAKQSVFMVGVLTQLLLNIQLRDKDAAPFRKRLNSLKLNKELIQRIFTEAIEKLEQYGKNYYRELEEDISSLLIKGGMEELSNDEISFYFTLGMTLYKNFKEPKADDLHNEN